MKNKRKRRELVWHGKIPLILRMILTASFTCFCSYIDTEADAFIRCFRNFR